MKIKIVKIIDKLFAFIKFITYHILELYKVISNKIKMPFDIENWILLRQAIEYLVDGRQPTYDREQIRNRLVQ